MTFSYSTDFDNPINVIRHRIGDTVAEDHLLEDEEIQLEIDETSGTRAAAAACCLAISLRYAMLADTKDGELTVEAGSISKRYQELAQALSSPSSSGLPTNSVPFAGGVSRGDKRSRGLDNDVMRPLFERDLPGGRPIRTSMRRD